MDEITINIAEIASKATCHHIPCKLSYDGSAKVSTYFVPLRGEDGVLTAHFRGRKLEGHEVQLPTGIIGLIAHETAPTEAAPARTEAAPQAPYLGDLLDDDDDDNYDSGFGGGGGFADLGDGDDDDGGCDAAGAGVHAGQKRPREEDAQRAADKAGCSGTGLRRNWAVDGSFTHLVYWLHDRPAGEGDVMHATLEWIRASRELHAPVSPEDVAILGGLIGTPVKAP